MIIDKIENLGKYISVLGSPDAVSRAAAIISSGKFEIGTKYVMAAKEVFFTPSVCEKRAPEDAEFETHHIYADVHAILEGDERVRVADEKALTPDGEFDAAADFGLLTGKAELEVTVPAGSFYIVLPGEAHMPNLTTKPNTKLVKAVIKVKI